MYLAQDRQCTFGTIQEDRIPSKLQVHTPQYSSLSSKYSPLKLGLDYSRVLYYDKAQGRFLEYSADKKELTSLSPGVAYYLYSPADTSWALQFPVSSTSFLYDGDGGRVRKTTDDGRGTTASVTYVGALFEIDSSGKTTKHIFAGANRVATKGQSPAGTDPEVYYYHSDHLGSSSIITDSSGQQAQHLEYTPYGTIAQNEITQGLSPQGTVPVKK